MNAEPHVLDTIDPVVVGRRLAEVRKARGLTQQQAAEALGVARTTLTAIEQGIRPPRASELVTLARLYGRQVGDLVRPVAPRPEPSFVVQFRAARGPAADIPDAERDADSQRFEELVRWYVELERMLDAPLPRRYPDVYDISGTTAERAGEDVAASERNRLGLGDSPVGDLWGILETDVGLRVFAMPMASGKVAGMFLFSEEYGACVAVNANHPEEKRLSTLAHEYAHFLTNERHRPDITVLSAYKRVPEGERFAEAFARNFLMPATGLSRRVHAMRRSKDAGLTPADVLTLSHLYRVSFQTMMWRLEELKLLPGGAWERLREEGFKPTEAKKLLDLPAAPERSLLPLRYETLAAQAYNGGLISEGQLARMMATDRVSALLRVRELTRQEHPTEDGDWQQITLDLSATLAGAS